MLVSVKVFECLIFGAIVRFGHGIGACLAISTGNRSFKNNYKNEAVSKANASKIKFGSVFTSSSNPFQDRKGLVIR